MKKLVAQAPRVAALVEYQDRAVAQNEVKIRVRFGAPKHGTEVVDFRAASPFIDEEFSGEWQLFTPRPADAPRGIEFGKFQLGNMVVGEIIECGAQVTAYAVGDQVCTYGPLMETVIVNAVDNYKLRKMPQGGSWKNAVCYDPAQFAMSGVRDGNVRVGDFVVVIGLGAIGQIAVQLAKKAGASVVIGVDPIAHRCDKRYTDAECDALTQADMTHIARQIDPHIKVNTTDTQRAAIYSFAYNVGPSAAIKSTLMKKLNDGDYVGACNELKRWIYAGGKKWRGLMSRREVEHQVCMWDR